jgi:hypothetical protein
MKTKLKLAGAPARTIKRSIAARWTPALARGGWTPVVDFFLDNYHRLPRPLTSLEAMLVIHLMRHKWSEDHPYPAFKTIAKKMGVTATAVRNHARSLEAGKHYLHRIMRVGRPNRFDLTPLFAALEKLQAQDAAAEMKKDRTASSA